MILRWSTLLWLVAFAVAVGLVFQIKYEVQDLEDRLARTQTRIQKDREALHVLRAEWSYLNQPQRIARLAQRHLEMIPLKAPQIGRIASLPPRPERMDGRVFAAGPPLPPRAPGALAGAWRPQPPAEPGPRQAPQPAPRPDADDPIGALVAATLDGASPDGISPDGAARDGAARDGAAPAAAPPRAPARKLPDVAEPLPKRLETRDAEGPRNPVTGAPLPVGTRFVSETR